MRMLLALTLLGVLAGCGQTGPLYLPGEAPAADETPVSEPEPGAG